MPNVSRGVLGRVCANTCDMSDLAIYVQFLQRSGCDLRSDIARRLTNTSQPVHLAHCAACGKTIARSAGRHQRAWRHVDTGLLVCTANTLAEPTPATENDNLTDADLIHHLRTMADAQRDGILAVAAFRMERLATALEVAEAGRTAAEARW